MNTETGLSLLEADHRALVSRSDLIYRSPVEAPIEGLPIGNGRMGTLVWTTPDAIHFQINRGDVFAVNGEHVGGQFGPTDYCGGCARVSVRLGGEPFRCGETFYQRLSLYDAEVSLAGEGVRARCFVSSVSDALVLEVDDQRVDSQSVRVAVSLWREPEVKTGDHVARYRFADAADDVLLLQEFEESDYYCASAVAARVDGGGRLTQTSQPPRRSLTAPSAGGCTTIILASAASWSRDDDVGEVARGILAASSRRTYEDLRREHEGWWTEFWSRTFVQIFSPDGVGDFMGCLRHLHLYHLASTSRGALPPKWNGSLFATEGDTRTWGSQFWVWTTEMLYFPLLAADAVELTDSYFNMYVRQLPAAEIAASQRWGSRGAYFPETSPFDGATILPHEIVAEVRDVLLGRKEHGDLSDGARLLCAFDGHLRVVAEPHEGRYSWISHVASSGSEVAIQAWWRYRYTGDKTWLRTHAYPLLKGTVEFYRHLVSMGEDGKLHVHGTHAHEDFWGVTDSIMDLAAIRGTVPLAIRAAAILGIDADLRVQWQSFFDSMAPYPMGRDPGARALTSGVLADDVWAAGYLGDMDGSHNSEDVWLNPVFPFEDWTRETCDPAMDRIVQRVLDLAPRHASVLAGNPLNTAIRTPIVAARAGRGCELPVILASYYAAFSPLPNGMSLFEGPQAASVEHLGLLTTTLQEALLQSVSPRPGEPETISVFPAWPDQWDASFRLLARGGFLVTSSMRDGEVEFVEVQSRLGETCRLRNPWDGSGAVVQDGGGARQLADSTLCFDTRAGVNYRLLPAGRPEPVQRSITATPTTEPTAFRATLPSGTTVEGTLGRMAENPVRTDC
ncbi:MAG: DUF5703 domain-containing protein [Candidatus Latescibacterota bacterium]|nr:DUF5703 domain-containing protein [Candidatus Latescibacterota bacterium]